MIKNILLAVVLTLGTATLFAPRADKSGRRSPKKSVSPKHDPFSVEREMIQTNIDAVRGRLSDPCTSPARKTELKKELTALTKKLISAE